jgi:hypothetical protein
VKASPFEGCSQQGSPILGLMVSEFLLLLLNYAFSCFALQFLSSFLVTEICQDFIMK